MMSLLTNSKFASLLLVLLSIIASSAGGVDFNAICSKTLNPPHCLSVLRSTPGTGSTDLQGLANIIINVAHSNATNTLSLVQILLKKATDPQIKQKLSSCSEHFDNAAGNLQDALQKLATDDYNGVNLEVSAAMTEADDCRDELGTTPTPLPKNIEDLNNVSGIILVIANLLLRRRN